MNPVQEPVTGKEAQVDISSSYQALVQFYRAFNSRDSKLMAENWMQSDEITMDNPLGGIKRGWNEINAVYERIFNGPASVYVEFYDYTIHETSDVFYAVGRERGYCRLDNDEIKLAIRTSRIFRKHQGRWRQVHHHGSIEDASLLARYQYAVLGKTS
jgi:ketosteroid isomerase-like protein